MLKNPPNTASNTVSSAAFDKVAFQYDAAFTHTQIGNAQRMCVWEYLKVVFQEDFTKEKTQKQNPKKLNILEITCGTGEDAIWLAKQGHNVCATDISPEMIGVAQQKAKNITENNANIYFESIDFQDITENTFNTKFDLVFSNFGGLNCVPQENLLRWINTILPKILHQKGRFIAVIMPKFCLWESLYFLAKLKLKKAFRRYTNKPQIANLDNLSSIQTWYHQPKMLKENIKENFEFVHLQGVGFVLPPSYLNTFFARKAGLLNFLNKMEHLLVKNSILSNIFANMSDHYLIDFQKK